MRPQGADETAWTGPLLRAFGRSDGEHLGGVTAYIPVAAGAYDLRSVRADATDCATPYPASTSIPPLPFFTSYGLTPIEAGARRTIVITGDAGRSNQLFELPDDFTTEPGTAKVRFVHTRWVYTDLTLGAGTGDSFVPWSPRTPPASQASNATYAAGYTQVPAGPGQTVTLRSGGNVELATIPFDVPEGAAITFFPYGGSPGDSLRACFDNAESVDGLTPCTLLLDAPQ